MKPSSPAPPSAPPQTTRANGHRAPNYGSFESPQKAPHVHNSGQDSKVAINWAAKSGESGAAAAAEAGRAAEKKPPREESGLLLRLARRIPCLGIMLALMASLFLGSAGMLVKLTRSVHGIQVAVLR